MPNFIGQSLGRYHILEQLGEGGMATVYKAYDTRLERDVAVKVIRVDQFAPAVLQRILKRFEREAKALARLTHPNIVPVIDYGEYEGTPYLVMPYLPGGTLKQRLGMPIPWQEAVRILLPIAQALDYAHEQKIIHRDIKPSNILLTKKGQPMLSDFGIAKILDLDDGQTLSTPGVGIGTPEYMSPEQGLGKPVGPATDVYSLGIVLYELLTGCKPYTADTPYAVVDKHLHDPLPSPRQFVPSLPEDIEKILLKALAKRPEDRYEDMAAFVVALENLTSRPISQPDAPRPRVGDSMAANDQVATRDEIDPAPAKRIAISTSQRNPPNVLQDKKRAWWPWAAGAGGLVAVAGIVVAMLVVPGLLAAPQPAATSTPTYTYTNTRISTDTPIPPPTFTLTPILGIGSTWTRPADGMLMVYVPEGSFTMGAPDGTGNGDERPQHMVYLDAYWIDKTDVTNAMYALCIQKGACQLQQGTDSSTRDLYYGNSLYEDYPVINVDWNQADTYCRWAGAQLPTEAQWEKAARGTDGRTYPWGNNDPNISLMKYNDLIGDTSAVGSYPSNASPYGALDMAGNVAQWVADWYDANYYSLSPQNNPLGPNDGKYRVRRGGNASFYEGYSRYDANGKWLGGGQYPRTYTRRSTDRGTFSGPYINSDTSNTGFRCVLASQ